MLGAEAGRGGSGGGAYEALQTSLLSNEVSIRPKSRYSFIYVFLVSEVVFTEFINPYVPSRFFYFNSLHDFISYIRGVWLVFIIAMFVEISGLNADSVDPDQTSRSAASDLDLLCLPISILWDARLI